MYEHINIVISGHAYNVCFLNKTRFELSVPGMHVLSLRLFQSTFSVKISMYSKFPSGTTVFSYFQSYFGNTVVSRKVSWFHSTTRSYCGCCSFPRSTAFQAIAPCSAIENYCTIQILMHSKKNHKNATYPSSLFANRLRNTIIKRWAHIVTFIYLCSIHNYIKFRLFNILHRTM